MKSPLEMPPPGAARRGVVGYCGILFLVLLASSRGIGVAYAGAGGKEYQVKAAMLLNFATFIQWPASVFPNPQTPITIGVLGDDPFGPVLDQLFRDEMIQDRAVVIKRSHQLDDLKNCQLLFISNSEKDRLPDILSKLNAAPIVTVGETEGFARQGGIINFYLDDNRVHFAINAKAASHEHIRISAQLLERARIVKSSDAKDKE